MHDLIKYFDIAFDAPDGIKKLREIILSLAMQGKLVPQNPPEGTASDLLKEIEKEKKKLIKEGKIKPPKPLPPIKPEDTPHEIPPSWQWVRLGEVADHNVGKTLDKNRNSGSLRKYITTSNLYWGRFELENLRSMAISENELEKVTVKLNDLLICEGGDAGRAAVWNFHSEICFQNHIHRVRFFNNLFPYFFFRFFEKLYFTNEIDLYRKGVGISSISSKVLSNIIVPLPPLAEQHRIVKKIESLMALCDAMEELKNSAAGKLQSSGNAAIEMLISSRDEESFNQNWNFIRDNFEELFSTPENIKSLKKAILQLAVMGKLVPQIPSEGTATDLLKEIEKEKKKLIKEGKIKPPKPLPPIKPEDQQYKIPPTWQWVRLENITENKNNCLKAGPFGSSLKKNMYVPSGYKIYGQEQVISGNENYGDYYIDEDKYNSLISCAVCPGDILVSLVGTIGKILILSENCKPGIINPRLVKISLDNRIDRTYFSYMFNSPYINNLISTQSHGGTMNILNLGLLKGFPLPLPPLAEQHRIVKKIESLLTECEALEESIQKKTKTQTTLLHSIY